MTDDHIIERAVDHCRDRSGRVLVLPDESDTIRQAVREAIETVRKRSRSGRREVCREGPRRHRRGTRRTSQQIGELPVSIESVLVAVVVIGPLLVVSAMHRKMRRRVARRTSAIVRSNT